MKDVGYMFYAHAHSGGQSPARADRRRPARGSRVLIYISPASVVPALTRQPVMCLFNDRLVNQINITLTFGHYLEDEQIFCKKNVCARADKSPDLLRLRVFRR